MNRPVSTSYTQLLHVAITEVLRCRTLSPLEAAEEGETRQGEAQRPVPVLPRAQAGLRVGRVDMCGASTLSGRRRLVRETISANKMEGGGGALPARWRRMGSAAQGCDRC
jgi:hypothetical protein